MKKHFIILLILPVCFILFSLLLRKTEGPVYNSLADPSYAYLINSLSLAQMEGYHIGHVDHPGTPLQILGAKTIKILYTFSHEKDNMAEDVLYRPEYYINAIDYTLILLNAMGLYIMGLIIFSVKKNIFTSLFFQTVPFVSMKLLEVFSQVKTENYAFFLIVILISLMIKYVYDPPDNINPFIFLAGVLCGLILATKISFICIMIIPLILFPGIKKKMFFLAVVSGSFIAFVLPAISNINYFISWVGKLIVYTDRYGKGNDSVINTDSYLNNIAKIINNERFFAVVYLLILIILVISFITKKRNESIRNETPNEMKFLAALFTAMTVHVLLVAKHFSNRYMFPAIILAVPGLFLVIYILYKKYIPNVNAKMVFAILFVFTFLYGAYNSRKIIARTKTRVNETVKLNNFIKSDYPDADIILSSGVSNEYTGLILAYFYSGDNVKDIYKKIIIERFPNQTWYDIFHDNVYSLTDSHYAVESLKSGKMVLYQTMDEVYNKSFVDNLKTNFDMKDVTLTKVYSNDNGELLFKLITNY